MEGFAARGAASPTLEEERPAMGPELHVNTANRGVIGTLQQNRTTKKMKRIMSELDEGELLEDIGQDDNMDLGSP